MSTGVVVLGYGPQPIDFFKHVTKACGKDAVVDPDVARMAGANLAGGTPDALAALRKRLEAGSLQVVRAETIGVLSPEAQRWLACGERGSSSEALFTRLSGVNCTSGAFYGRADANHPYDPDDFRRCRLMLEACPELAANLRDAAGMSHQWAALVADWENICTTMDGETPGWRSPHGNAQFAHKTYQLIQQAIGR